MGSAPTIRLTVFVPRAGFLKIHLIQEKGVIQPNSCLFGPNKTRPNFCINKLTPSVGHDTRSYSEKISAMANTTPIVTTVTKTATKEKTPNGAEAASRVNILNFCEEHYEDILPVMDKIRRDKRKEVHTRLDFGENSRKSQRMREDSKNSSAKTLSARYRNPSERPQIRDRLRNNDGNVFSRLVHQRKNAFKRLSDTYSPSTTKSGPDREYSRDGSYSRGRPHKRDSSPSRDRPQSRDRSHDIKESYGNTYPSYRTGDKHRYHSHGIGRSSSMKRERNSESSLSRVSESGTNEGGNSKSKSKRRKPTDEEDLAVPWSYEEADSFTPRIRNFKMEIHNIKQKDGETIEDFMERFKGAPECMRIFGFMHGVNNPELTKRLNEHVPKTVEEMMIAIAAFIGGETTAASKKSSHSLEVTGPVQTPWQRVTRHKVTQSFDHVKEITFPPLTANKGTGGPLVIKAEISGHAVHCIYMDKGSSMEHYSYIKAWMNFMVMRSPSSYNGIIGRPGKREIQAVPSTAHRMLKFPVNGRIVTIRSTILMPTECTTIAATPKDHAKKAEARHENFEVAIHSDFSDQEITIGGTISIKARTQLYKAFDRQIGQNLEIYVDDLVIKSHTEIELLRDIEETLCTL
nr:hypothetical protein [Tanacetum cinerariifolium]